MPAPLPPVEHQFKPGQSGNPKGRPKGAISLVAILREKLAEIPPGSEDRKTYADLFIQRALGIALNGGDVAMIRDILNRIDGLPQGSLDLNTSGEQKHVIEIHDWRGATKQIDNFNQDGTLKSLTDESMPPIPADQPAEEVKVDETAETPMVTPTHEPPAEGAAMEQLP